MFRDRIEAGLLLAQKLRKYQGEQGVILAVPRGGIPVAYSVAKELGMPLDIILTKKIGHPANPEYAIGAVSLTDYFVLPHDDVSHDYIIEQVERIRKKLKAMYQAFKGHDDIVEIKGKTIIVIDDGIATGNTLMGTVNMLLKERPAKIVVAAPVASRSAVRMLSTVVDEVVTVLQPETFYGVGAFYEDFEQVSDEEAMYYLERWRRETKKTG